MTTEQLDTLHSLLCQLCIKLNASGQTKAGDEIKAAISVVVMQPEFKI